MLKAHSKFLEQLMLAGDIGLVAACWLLAYFIRFYVLGPAIRGGDVPPLGPYLLMLAPILVVWGVSFRAFDLYRPRRIGSHLSEAADIAKSVGHRQTTAHTLLALFTVPNRGELLLKDHHIDEDVIHNGKGGMPAWKGVLTERDMRAVLIHVRSLAKH